jgi:ribosomal protein S9
MSFGAPPPGMDEYQRLMAERAAAAKRKRTTFALIAVVVVGGGVFAFQKSASKNKQAQAILDAAGRFAERDKSEMGAFWNCAMSSEVDVGMFNSADQIQQRIESAYFTQQKTYSDHLIEECVPKLKGAQSALASIPDMPDVLKPSLDKYLAALPKMQTGLETYAEKLKTRGAVKDVDASIQEVGGAFTADATAQSVAFAKFLECAVPDLEKKKDLQTLLQDLADTCKKDPVPFMTKARTDCGSLVTGVDKDANAKGTPDKAFKGIAKKFIEEDNSRLLQAWEFCGKRSRKGKKVLDLEDFLLASSDYMEARGELVKTAREESARVTGQPLPQEKEKPGAAP